MIPSFNSPARGLAAVEPSWLGAYLRVPHRRHGRTMDGADCLGLVLLALRAEAGVIASEPGEIYARVADRSGPGLLAAIRAEADEWNWLGADAEPLLFDVILFMMDGAPGHVGLSLGDGRFLHMLEGVGAQATLLEGVWGRRIVTVLRHD